MKAKVFCSIGIKSLTVLIGLFLLFSTSCKKDGIDDDDLNNGSGNGSGNSSGKVEFVFDFVVDGAVLQFDTLMYVNAAGNQYMVYNIQYFISNITIYKNGVGQVLDKYKKERYIDTGIPSTLVWDLNGEIVPGSYDSLSFTFGFTDADNQSQMFNNPPEINMIWPDFLGGGYHYMKLNGKWKSTQGALQGFGMHLGRGQVLDSTGTPISYIDNSFRVSIPDSDFEIIKDKNATFTIRMDVDEWFKDPAVYDFNVLGGMIMQKQNAMKTLANNGWNVFEFKE